MLCFRNKLRDVIVAIREVWEYKQTNMIGNADAEVGGGCSAMWVAFKSCIICWLPGPASGLSLEMNGIDTIKVIPRKNHRRVNSLLPISLPPWIVHPAYLIFVNSDPQTDPQTYPWGLLVTRTERCILGLGITLNDNDRTLSFPDPAKVIWGLGVWLDPLDPNHTSFRPKIWNFSESKKRSKGSL